MIRVMHLNKWVTTSGKLVKGNLMGSVFASSGLQIFNYKVVKWIWGRILKFELSTLWKF